MKPLHLLLLVLALFPSLVSAGSYTLTYGSNFSTDPESALFFGDEYGHPLYQKEPGVLAVGYFNDGFDPVTAVQEVSNTGIAPILDAFNPLHSTSSTTITTPGYIQGAQQIDDLGTGKTPYIFLLSGITSYEHASHATGAGLFTNSTFQPFPVGGDLIPTEFDITSINFDTVILGTIVPTSNPSNGQLCKPTALGKPPFSLSGSSPLANDWWTSPWLGVYYLDPDSHWIYQPSLGWVFANSSNPDGLWIWQTTVNAWLYTDNQTYPCLWAESLQQWLYPDTTKDPLEFWHWNSSTSMWYKP